MAIDLPPALKSFVDVPYVVQASGAASNLMERAATALAAMGKPDARLGFGEGAAFRDTRAGNESSGDSGIGVASSAPLPAVSAPVPLSEFHALVTGIQARLDRELPRVEGYRIAVFDNSAPDYAKEVTRLLGDRRAAGPFERMYMHFGRGAGGFATPYSPSAQSATCLVVGMRPNVTLAQGAYILPGVVPAVGKASTAEFHVHLEWHEVGHCLLGSSEMHADTFGALMSVQSGVSRDTLSVIANIREVGEMMVGDVADDHETSQAVAWVARNYDRLRADPSFMKMDVLGVASFAKAVADRYAPGVKGLADSSRVRRADETFFRMRAHYAMTPDGIRPLNHIEYLRANADKVSVFARLVNLRSRIGDMTVPPTDFRIDVDEFRRQLGSLAATGDPTAAAMLESLDAPAPTKPFGRPEMMPLVHRIADGTKFASRFFAMDTANVKVSFSHDQSSFGVRDPNDGSVRMTNAMTGETRHATTGVEPVAFRR